MQERHERCSLRSVRTLSRCLVVALLGAAALPYAALADPVRPPAGLCAVAAGGTGYRATLWQRFGPPAGQGASLRALAVDCASLEAADAGRPDRPRRLMTVIAGDGTDDLPKTLPGLIEQLDRRYAARPDYLGHDDVAVYVAQRGATKEPASPLVGASAFTSVGGATWIVNVFTLGEADTAASRREVEGVVRQLQGG